MQKLNITIIIPTMNRVDSLINTVNSILSFAYVPNQIIIIDQSEKDEDIIKARNYVEKKCDNYNIDLIYKKLEVASSTKARNEGTILASNEIIIYSDDDVQIYENTLIDIYNLLFKDSISMVAVPNVNEMGNKKDSLFGYIFLRKSLFNRKIGNITTAIFGRYPSNLKGITDTQWAMGYFFAVKKSLIQEWKMKWDENLIQYAYAEDLDFSYSYYKQSKIHGFKCIISNSIKVRHLVSNEWRTVSWKVTLFFIINREYLSYKHFSGFTSRVATRWSNFGEFIKRLLIKDNPMDILKAQYYCDIYRKKIKQGNLKEVYEKLFS